MAKVLGSSHSAAFLIVQGRGGYGLSNNPVLSNTSTKCWTMMDLI